MANTSIIAAFERMWTNIVYKLSEKADVEHTHTATAIGADPAGSANTALQDAKSYTDTKVADKVDKVSGKGLSTNDYTTTEKNKLAGIAAGAEVNVQSDWNATSGDAFIKNKPTIPSKTSQLTNDSGYLTAHQDISGKADKTYVDTQDTTNLATAKSYTDTEVAKVYTLVGDESVATQIDVALGAYKPEWNTVQNKPFTTVGGDTLTWDGNTEGLVSVDASGDGSIMFYHVADCIITMSDLENGGTIGYADGTNSELLSDLGTATEQSYFDMGNSYVVTFMDNVVMDTTLLPKKGLYFLENEDFGIRTFTINGYTGFTKETIKTEVLPEHLQFGQEIEVAGDTLTWDGNTEGLEILKSPDGDDIIRLTGSTLTASDIANGGKITFVGDFGIINESVDATSFEMSPDNYGAQILMNDDLTFVAFLITVPYDNYIVETSGATFPKKGLYYSPIAGNITQLSFTINGYNGFITKTVTPIDQKYLPDNIATKETTTTATMSASSWTGNTYSFEADYPFASYNLEIEPDGDNSTNEQFDAFGAAMLAGSATTNVVKAFGEVPTIDIPVILKVQVK